ncbi:MAG: fumarate reductase subunit FrdD [Planctomycetota bacterium]|jgi:fumarate reductase subunit D
MKQSNEAFWWSIFSAGGVVSALALPVLIVITGLVLPVLDVRRGEAAYERIAGMVAWWPIRMALFVVFFLSFFHAAHRIRHILMDLGWREGTAPLSVMCYGGAVVGTGAAAFVLISH